MARTGRPHKEPRVIRYVSLRLDNDKRLKAIAERTGWSVPDVLNDWLDVTADVYAERLAKRETENIKNEIGIETDTSTEVERIKSEIESASK